MMIKSLSTVYSQQDIQSSDMFTQTKYICSHPTAVNQYFYFTYHTCLNNSLKCLQRRENPKTFPPNPIALHHTCSRKGQQRQQAAHRQQRLHFGCRGPSPHLPRLYILLWLKVRGHASGGGAQQMHPCQPLCVRAAARPNREC